ncbi:MAG: ice-binding family protein [Desulfuromonadaceae bacterium]|nr:ice-binding family protein [Desulfuromonadaceae bacterium]
MKKQIKVDIFRKLSVKLGAIALSSLFLAAAPFHPGLAEAAPALGTSASYAILGGTAVTLTDSTVTGDVGSGLPFSTVTQTTSPVTGTIHQGDASAIAAYSDFLVGYDLFAQQPCNVTLTGDLANQVLAPNVYCFDAAATLTGQLTLDGPANGEWIFKVGTLGTGALTGTNFSVVMSGGGNPCNVYWWAAEAATMTTSNFQGTLLSGAGSTFTGGSLMGRDLSKAGATLTGVAVSACGGAGPIIVPPVDPPKDHCKDKDHDHDNDKDNHHDDDHDKDHAKDHDKESK